MNFKSVVILFLSMLTLSSFSAETDQTEEINLRFWDGTFAYNELLVSSVAHQNNLLKITLKGSQISLGTQLEGTSPLWSWKDKMELFVRKSDCQIDLENTTVQCDINRTSVSALTWMVSQTVTKTYDGLIENVRIVANKGIVNVSFKVPSDENFTPHQEEINVSFFLTFF